MKYLAFLPYLILHIIDWKQTIMIVENPNRHWEVNNIMGRHPTKKRVAAYFSVCLIIIFVAFHFLPYPLEYVFIAFVAGIEAGVTWLNHQNGLKVW